MSAWDEISSTYAEAATQALPLHRVVVFVIGFLVSLAVQHKTHLSAIETLAVLPLSELISLDKGFLSKATAANILWALAATLLGVTLSKGLVRLSYSLVDRATGASSKAASLDKSWLSGLSIEDRNSAVALMESGLTEPRGRLRALTGLNELLVATGSVFLIASFWGNMLDGAIGVTALVVAVFTHVFAIHIFLSDYYGAALAKAHLQGKPSPKISQLNR